MNFASVAAANIKPMATPPSASMPLHVPAQNVNTVDAAKAPGYRGNAHVSPNPNSLLQNSLSAYQSVNNNMAAMNGPVNTPPPNIGASNVRSPSPPAFGRETSPTGGGESAQNADNSRLVSGGGLSSVNPPTISIPPFNHSRHQSLTPPAAQSPLPNSGPPSYVGSQQQQQQQHHLAGIPRQLSAPNSSYPTPSPHSPSSGFNNNNNSPATPSSNQLQGPVYSQANINNLPSTIQSNLNPNATEFNLRNSASIIQQQQQQMMSNRLDHYQELSAQLRPQMSNVSSNHVNFMNYQSGPPPQLQQQQQQQQQMAASNHLQSHLMNRLAFGSMGGPPQMSNPPQQQNAEFHQLGHHINNLQQQQQQQQQQNNSSNLSMNDAIRMMSSAYNHRSPYLLAALGNGAALNNLSMAGHVHRSTNATPSKDDGSPNATMSPVNSPHPESPNSINMDHSNKLIAEDRRLPRPIGMERAHHRKTPMYNQTPTDITSALWSINSADVNSAEWMGGTGDMGGLPVEEAMAAMQHMLHDNLIPRFGDGPGDSNGPVDTAAFQSSMSQGLNYSPYMNNGGLPQHVLMQQMFGSSGEGGHMNTNQAANSSSLGPNTLLNSRDGWNAGNKMDGHGSAGGGGGGMGQHGPVGGHPVNPDPNMLYHWSQQQR